MKRFNKRGILVVMVASLLLSLVLFGFGCGGGGGGGGGEGVAAAEPTPEFQAAQYFPLTSSWETDNWTLFVDERQHDVNGTMTKAMVDTSYPTVFYWTCDDDGLRLHGYIDEDEGPVDFSPPILIAAAVAKVGDRWEGTYTVKTEAGIDLGQIKVTSEIIGIEDVSVPAGNFADCFKLEVAELDPTDDSLFWKETWWLAKGVGLVKIVNDEESLDGFFARPGETRQLLGYYITPSALTPDEQEIKALASDFSEYLESEDLDSLMDLYSEDYYSKCRDKSQRRANWENTFLNNDDPNLFLSYGEIDISGDDAHHIEEWFLTGVSEGTGQRWWSWGRDTYHEKKENGQWKIYGNQLEFGIAWYIVWTRRYPDDSRYLHVGASVNDCAGNLIDATDQIVSFSITGPPGTFTDLDLTPYWDPVWLEYFLQEDIANARDGFYTFRLEDVNGNVYEFTDYLVVMPPLDIPNLVSPVNDAVVPPGYVALDWDDVDGADYYRVDLERDVDGSWIRENAWPSESQAVFILPGATDFRWRVRARQRDLYGEYYDNESRSGWAYFSTETETVNVIDPSDDGSIYSDGDVITDAYLRADGSIHGVVEFSLDSITTDSIIEATLSINPYLLPLQDETVDIFGYESNDGILTSNDYNAGTFLGTWVMPEGLGFGEDTFFDVTDFIRTVDSPYVGFSLRANNTDSFSSLEYNYGHPARLVTVIP